jgi:hypothetical protein
MQYGNGAGKKKLVIITSRFSDCRSATQIAKHLENLEIKMPEFFGLLVFGIGIVLLPIRIMT